MLKIIGGKKKRVTLEVPLKNVRPTSSIKREAIFSILESYAFKNNLEIYRDNAVLDLFAGTGSLGLESISRGAKFCYFYEIDDEVINKLKINCEKICEYKNYKIINKDILTENFSEIKSNISVIFIDPPYQINKFDLILNKINTSKLINKNTVVILETNKKTLIDVPNYLKIFDERIYGKTKISFINII